MKRISHSNKPGGGECFFFTLVTLLLFVVTTGCSNVIRSGLMNSNTIFLDPNTNRNIYTQLRNVSENQQVTLNEVNTKLAAKGYQLVQDPQQANFWIQAKVIYCHKAADSVMPEGVAKSGPGAGISSGGTAMVSVGSTGSIGDETSRGIAGMPDMNTLMRQAMAMSGGRAGFGSMSGFPSAQPPPKEDGVIYLCVTDVQIIDRKIGRPLRQPVGSHIASGQRVQKMRMVGHVRQKSLDIPEATPIVQEKISTGIAGLF